MDGRGTVANALKFEPNHTQRREWSDRCDREDSLEIGPHAARVADAHEGLNRINTHIMSVFFLVVALGA